MMFDKAVKRGKKRVKSERTKLWADFYIWDNWLKNKHFSLDNHPFRSQHFEVRRVQVGDVLYMSVFVNSQIIQRVVAEQIKSMFRKAGQAEPVFVNMRKFIALRKEILPEVL